MLQRLPVRVDPYRLAEKGQTLKGVLTIDNLPRVGALAREAAGQVECELNFLETAGEFYLNGQVEGVLRLTCQRCLEDFDLPVSSEFSLLLVEDDHMAERVQAYTEPLLIENNELVIATFIEDELLLSVPNYPLHENRDDCHVRLPSESLDSEPESADKHPFAVLEQLKKH